MLLGADGFDRSEPIGTLGNAAKSVIFKVMSRTDILSISCYISLTRMPQNLADE